MRIIPSVCIGVVSGGGPSRFVHPHVPLMPDHEVGLIADEILEPLVIDCDMVLSIFHGNFRPRCGDDQVCIDRVDEIFNVDFNPWLSKDEMGQYDPSAREQLPGTLDSLAQYWDLISAFINDYNVQGLQRERLDEILERIVDIVDELEELL